MVGKVCFELKIILTEDAVFLTNIIERAIT